MRMRLAMLATVVALLGTFLVAPLSVSAQETTNPLVDIPVTGNVQRGGSFEGTLDIVNFTTQGGRLLVEGLLSGTLFDRQGAEIGSVTDVPVTIPVQQASGTCDILHLDLGPLNLDLLGLQVHLFQIVLDIVAESGAGNLLGNLLCAVAGLLDGPGPLAGLAALLNQILGVLSGV